MTVAFFVGSDGHLRDVGVHHTVGKHEHDVCAAGTTVAPSAELDLCEIRDEVGLPHMISLPNLMKVTITGKVAVFTRTDREVIGVIENEGLVIEQVHHCRAISRRDNQRAISPAPIEVPVFRV